MRTLLVASFLFAPVLLHAQAMSPAQPAQNLQSKLVAPSMRPATETTSAVRVATPIRISTGVVAPTLVHTVAVEQDNRWYLPALGGTRTVTVALTVDEKGIPGDLKVVASTDPVSDRDVLNAVSKFRFTPGTLNGVATGVAVTLTVNVVHQVD